MSCGGGDGGEVLVMVMVMVMFLSEGLATCQQGAYFFKYNCLRVS